MVLTVLFLLVFSVTLTGGIGFWIYRVAMHLRGNEEATKAVVEHVLLPLIGRSPPVRPKEPTRIHHL